MTRSGFSTRASRSSAGTPPASAAKGRPHVAEHDSDREDREPDEQGVPFDEEAAWAAIVAGYGEEPKDPPGTKPFKSVEDLALLETETNDEPTATETQPKKDSPKRDGKPAKPLGGSVSFAPG